MHFKINEIFRFLHAAAEEEIKKVGIPYKHAPSQNGLPTFLFEGLHPWIMIRTQSGWIVKTQKIGINPILGSYFVSTSKGKLFPFGNEGNITLMSVRITCTRTLAAFCCMLHDPAVFDMKELTQ